MNTLLMRIAKKEAAKRIFGAPVQRGFANSVYLWASNPKLGPKASNLKQQIAIPKGVPKRIEVFDDLNVQTLKVGQRHSAVISEDGRLFMFGSGNWGVLGQGNEKDVRFDKPVQVTKFEKMGLRVVDIALGEYHSFALTEDGNVWTWGYPGKKGIFNWMYSQEIGALGHGDKEPHFYPKKVEYFAENDIKIKSISAGLYHCNAMTTEGKIYTWGRGLYGVLGNGSNAPSLEPQLNEDLEAIREDGPIIKMKSADEYSMIQTDDNQLYAWGKNDRGQMGTGSGMGIDLVECENVPTPVLVDDENEEPQVPVDFCIGQNTMMIQDQNKDIYMTGLKIHYTPEKLHFQKDIVDTSKITQMACGRKHYILLNDENQLYVWGNVFKQKSDVQTEGFFHFDGDKLFDEGEIKQLEVQYTIFGALVKH